MARIYKRKNSPFYSIDFTVGGERVRRSTTCRNGRDAQKEADAAEALAHQEFEASKGIRLIDAADLFFKYKSKSSRKLKPKTVALYKQNLSVVYRILGDIPLASVTSDTIKKYVATRLAEGGNVQISREFSFMSSLYTTTQDYDSSVTSNPWKDFNKRNVPNAQEVNFHFTDAEVQRLLAACNQSVHTCILTLALDTGMRKQEILQLHEREVDFDQSVIVLKDIAGARTKTGASREIPMSDRVAKLLESQKLAHLAHVQNDRHYDHWSGYFFENYSTRKPITDIKTFWGAVKKRAGINQGRFHDLRHTFATNGVRAGAAQTSLMGIMGHRSPQSFNRYVTAVLDSKRNAIDLMQRGTLLAHKPSDSNQTHKGE